jgi:hypothetical protein
LKNEIRHQSTLEKALDINTDQLWYGSFAEIGAGQEVARQFFQAGKASQTVALTISAYDMTFSDVIYGKEKSGRYVCDSRLRKMLDQEFTKLTDRLGNVRGNNTCFFSFADTVATSSGNKGTNSTSKSHGWMGVRFQHKPNALPSEVYLHVRLLDKQRLPQQETLSKLGVNLLHSCFYKTKDADEFMRSLFDLITVGSVSIDAIYFNGDVFKNYDACRTNLWLIENRQSEAIYFNAEGSVQNPSDALWGKNIFIQRAFYKPVTMTHLDIAARGLKHFVNEFSLKSAETLSIFEFTLSNRIKNEVVTLDEAVVKVKMLQTLNIPTLVSQFTLFYELKEFIRLYTDKPMAIVIGATHLEKLFDEKFYYDLSGGLLEGMGKLLGRFSRLYIYPHKTAEICLLTKSFFPPATIKHIYSHFVENKMIQDIAGCDEITEFVHSQDILKMIKAKNNTWKKYVPEKIHSLVLKALKD